MQTPEEKIVTDISAKTPTLSTDEKAALWNKIETALPNTPVVSPYSFSFFTKFKKQSAPVALALVALLSTTGLVAASEPARPGDSLFTIDQSVENIRLALASEDEKTRLEAEFAAERLIELSSVLEETLAASKESNQASTTTNNNDARVNNALAVTLSYFGSPRLSDNDKDNLYTDLAKILEGTPIKLDDERLKNLNKDSKIEIRSDDSQNDSRIEIRDGENRMRIREKDGELKIEVRGDWDDDLKEEEDRDEDRRDSDDDEDDEDNRGKNTHHDDDDIKDLDDDRKEQNNSIINEIQPDFITDDSRDSRDEDDNQDDENEVRDEEDRSDSDNDQTDDSSARLKIEVEVEDGTAEVKLEQASGKTEFSLPYTTKTSLVTALALKTGLSESAVLSALELEFKD